MRTVEFLHRARGPADLEAARRLLRREGGQPPEPRRPNRLTAFRAAEDMRCARPRGTRAESRLRASAPADARNQNCAAIGGGFTEKRIPERQLRCFPRGTRAFPELGDPSTPAAARSGWPRDPAGRPAPSRSRTGFDPGVRRSTQRVEAQPLKWSSSWPAGSVRVRPAVIDEPVRQGPRSTAPAGPVSPAPDTW